MKANISRWVHDDFKIKVDGITYNDPFKGKTGLMQMITARTVSLTQVLRKLRMHPKDIAQFPNQMLGMIGEDIAKEIEWQINSLHEIENSMVRLELAVGIDEKQIELVAIVAMHQRRTAPVGMTVFVTFMLPAEGNTYFNERMR